LKVSQHGDIIGESRKTLAPAVSLSRIIPIFIPSLTTCRYGVKCMLIDGREERNDNYDRRPPASIKDCVVLDEWTPESEQDAERRESEETSEQSALRVDAEEESNEQAPPQVDNEPETTSDNHMKEDGDKEKVNDAQEHDVEEEPGGQRVVDLDTDGDVNPDS